MCMACEEMQLYYAYLDAVEARRSARRSRGNARSR